LERGLLGEPKKLPTYKTNSSLIPRGVRRGGEESKGVKKSERAKIPSSLHELEGNTDKKMSSLNKYLD
jgi:hypothetical protein